MRSRLLTLEGRAWSASFLNVAAMALQLFALWNTWSLKGVSVGMLGIFLYVQITFAQVGRRDKSSALFWGMVASAALIASSMVLAAYIFFTGPAH